MTKKLWGGRFSKELHPSAKAFSYSLSVDSELLGAEIKVSMAHAIMLGQAGLISTRESRLLIEGLWKTLRTLRKKSFAEFAGEVEDIHTLIQETLETKVGRVAKKLHTARSRNDLVTTSTRLYLKGCTLHLLDGLSVLQRTLLRQAQAHAEILIPGYTHLQRAQVVLLGHHLLAYVEMLERDKSRFEDAMNRFDECPLGSAALAGTQLNIDRVYVSKLLGFKRPSANSMDAVSSRDYVAEVLSCLAISQMHLSRLSEDLILWSSQEFQFVHLDDRFATGSSLMPHKKNPDMLELVRGKTGETYGSLLSVLTMLKGLALTYNRDMQEDKKPLFRALHTLQGSLEVLSGVVETLTFDQERCAKAVKDSFLYATDVLDYLVKKKVAFREAHDIVGRLVQEAIDSHLTLSGLDLSVYQKHSKTFGRDVFDLFDAKTSVNAKVSTGSTKPQFVAGEIKRWKKLLKVKAVRAGRGRGRHAEGC